MSVSTYGQDQVLSFISGLSRSLGVSIGIPECSPQCRGKKVVNDKRTFMGTEVTEWEGEDDQEVIFLNEAGQGKELIETVSLPVVLPRPVKAPPAKRVGRVLPAPVTTPQDLHFTVPANLLEQQFSVCVEGPHGPIMVQLPQDAVPGEQRTWRLGPPGKQVVVPEGAEEGSVIDCEVDGTSIHVTVPAGKVPGDVFETLPPSLVVMIPASAAPGDLLEFPDPSGKVLQVPLPEGLVPGQYFTLLL